MFQGSISHAIESPCAALVATRAVKLALATGMLNGSCADGDVRSEHEGGGGYGFHTASHRR
jgi:hypothetical protein